MKRSRSPTIHAVLRQIPYALYVIVGSGKDDSDHNALVVSWLTQCSFDPPLLMIALRKGSRSYDLMRRGKAFSVNLIDKSERRLARELVKPAQRVGNKLEKFANTEGDTGVPILRRAFAYLECKVREIREPGDHALVIGEVVKAGQHNTGEQLMCSDLRWHYAG